MYLISERNHGPPVGRLMHSAVQFCVAVVHAAINNDASRLADRLIPGAASRADRRPVWWRRQATTTAINRPVFLGDKARPSVTVRGRGGAREGEGRDHPPRGRPTTTTNGARTSENGKVTHVRPLTR